MNCKVITLLYELLLIPSQRRTIRRTKIVASTVIRHSSVPCQSVSKTAARCVSPQRCLSFTYSDSQYCPEPKDDEEKELQETEDSSYVRGRIQYVTTLCQRCSFLTFRQIHRRRSRTPEHIRQLQPNR